MSDILFIGGLVSALIVLGMGINAAALRVRSARLLRRAQRLMSLGEHRQALPLLTRAIALDPKAAFAHALRSQALLQSGVLERAFADAEEAVRLAPRSHYGYQARARLYASLGQYSDVVKDLERALEHNPAWLTGYLELARCYLILGDVERGLANLERLTERAGEADAPLLYDALVLAGRVRQESLHDLDGAIASYSRAIALVPERRVAYLERGWAFRDRGEYQRAAADLLRAAQCPQQYEDLRLHHWLQAAPHSWFDAVARECGDLPYGWMSALERLLSEDATDAPDFDVSLSAQAAEPQIYLN